MERYNEETFAVLLDINVHRESIYTIQSLEGVLITAKFRDRLVLGNDQIETYTAQITADALETVKIKKLCKVTLLNKLPQHPHSSKSNYDDQKKYCHCYLEVDRQYCTDLTLKSLHRTTRVVLMYDRKITDLDAWMRRIHGYIAYVYRPDVYKCINVRNGIEIKSEIIPLTETAIKPISKRLKPKGDSLYSNLHMLANAIDDSGETIKIED